MPLVSVVIPAYNRETYLAHAVESVLAQTYANVEHIVRDEKDWRGRRDSC